MIKNIPEALIETVCDGQFHSGEALGAMLGVSRAAVWKQLQKLTQAGLVFESVRGKGYRLVLPFALLDKTQILHDLSAVSIDASIEVHRSLASTNSHLMAKLAQSTLAQGHCVLAEMQTAGRGRRGRQWVSPFAQNLYFSLLWQFQQGVTALDGLSLVVGMSIAKTLATLTGKPMHLKWPNDVLCGNKKVVGILLELTGDPNGLCQVVIGIGINVNSRVEDGLVGVDQPWSSLYSLTGQGVDRNALFAQLYAVLVADLQQFEAAGFSSFMSQWKTLDAYDGQEVCVTLGDKILFGKADGVNEKGELRLLDEKGQASCFNGGEVSLRRKF